VAQADLTQLLRRWGEGDANALDALAPLVQSELRALAAAYLRRERRGHTLQPTALVNEAYLRLFDQTRVRFENRAHFFGLAAQLMRRILVDHARQRRAAKRGGGAVRVTLHDEHAMGDGPELDLLELDAALDELAGLSARQARVVELKFFGGLAIDECATALDVSHATVERDWTVARAFLRRKLRA
jgi:RNA polymerase sigma factor (TIGR02999 family)